MPNEIIESARLTQKIGEFSKLVQKETVMMQQIDYAIAGVISEIIENENLSNHGLTSLYNFLVFTKQTLDKQKSEIKKLEKTIKEEGWNCK